MLSSQVLRVFVVALVSLLGGGVVAASEQTPTAVSPGGGADTIGETTSCPTFSWSAVDGAEGYELAVFEAQGRLPESPTGQPELDGVEPRWRVEIPGRALSWTPSRKDCFEAGRVYGWAVRARGSDAGFGWSDVQLFRVGIAPAQEEVEVALKVLGRLRKTSDLSKEPRQPAQPSPAELPPKVQQRNQPRPAIITPSGFSLSLSDSLNMGGFLFLDGEVFLHNDNGNVGLGWSAAASTTTGAFNIALGTEALRDNTEGSSNVAVGVQALVLNSSGAANVAVGDKALLFGGTGSRNTGVGASALFSNRDASDNTAIGNSALFWSSEGSSNTAVGKDALVNCTGSNNIALGKGAGSNATTGLNNIYIGNVGAEADDGVIRIGADQSRTYIDGISGVPIAGGSAVVIGVDNRLGTLASSRRFKKDIHDLGNLGRRVLDLHPVTFRYRENLTEGQEGPLQYGLIAEEVSDVLPGLVVADSEGNPLSVRYDLLAPLLVSEMQRQQKEIDHQRREISRLRRDLLRLEKRKQ